MKRPLRPASRLGWWAFWLGFATATWGALLTSLPGLLGPFMEDAAVRIPIGLTSAILEIVLAISALVAGILALRRGERSWLTLLAFVAALLIGGFWIFFALGEVIWPH